MATNEVLEFFGRHFVAITIAYRFKNETGPDRFAAASGTVIEMDGIYAVLTAGHVIDAFDEILNHPEFESLTCALADTYGATRLTTKPIPYDLKEAPRFHIDQGGLDFGLLFLHDLQVRMLQAHKIVPLDRQGLSNEPDDLDVFWLLGLPAELNSTHVSPEGYGETRLTMVRIAKPGPNVVVPPTDFPRFAGEIVGELPLKSIEGMSGGPIFGISSSRPEKYWIVAIQSSWRDRRVVFGCPTIQIAAILQSLRNRVIEERPDLVD